MYGDNGSYTVCAAKATSRMNALSADSSTEAAASGSIRRENCRPRNGQLIRRLLGDQRPLGQLVDRDPPVWRGARDGALGRPSGPAEVRELAEAFNAMSLRVASCWTARASSRATSRTSSGPRSTTLGVAVSGHADARRRG